jgi:hypothetical protein
MGRLTIDKDDNKQKKEIPAGATILNTNEDVRVEKIENGFLITKTSDIKYSVKNGSTEYAYITKKWFSEEDPLTISSDNKELADVFK